MPLQPLAGFRSLRTHHCVTGSLRHIYEFHDYPISEGLLLGLGAENEPCSDERVLRDEGIDPRRQILVEVVHVETASAVEGAHEVGRRAVTADRPGGEIDQGHRGLGHAYRLPPSSPLLWLALNQWWQPGRRQESSIKGSGGQVAEGKYR